MEIGKCQNNNIKFTLGDYLFDNFSFDNFSSKYNYSHKIYKGLRKFVSERVNPIKYLTNAIR